MHQHLFGEPVTHALSTIQQEWEKKKRGEDSELVDLLMAKEWKSLFNIPDGQVY